MSWKRLASHHARCDGGYEAGVALERTGDCLTCLSIPDAGRVV